MKVKIQCPECGCLNEKVIDTETTQNSRPIVTLCEFEEGGCDCYFAFTFNLKIAFETFSLSAKKFAKHTV